jgi:hypothetical protein
MPWGTTEEPNKTLTMPDSIPVHVVSSYARPGKQIGTEFGQFRTFAITSAVGGVSTTPGAVRLCSRSLRRKRLHIIVNASIGANGGTLTADGGPVADPGASTLLASITSAQMLAVAPLGTSWSVTWSAILQGTVTAADGNNMELVMPLGTPRQVGLYPGLVGNYPQLPVALTPLAGQNISVATIAAASGAAADYATQISATPLAQDTTDGIVVGSREFINSGNPLSIVSGVGNGGYLQIGDNLRWECQQELWAAWPSTNSGPPVYVTVCDEQYASDPEEWRNEEEE